jgi:hypothetical protein
MTTPQDPFTAPATPPANAPVAPGLTGAPVPPPATYATSQYAPKPPRALATWTIVLTGVITAISLVSAVLTPMVLDSAKEQMMQATAGGSTTQSFTVLDVFSYLTWPIQIGAFVALALWWGAVRKVRQSRGYVVGGIPAVEWWGWLVPFANYALPILGMRSLTKGLVGAGPLAGWWVAWSLYWTATWTWLIYVPVAVLGAWDPQHNDLSNVDFMDGAVPLNWALTVLISIAWAFLAYIVHNTTKRLEENAA